MRQRRQLPPHFSVQERPHALVQRFKVQRLMHKRQHGIAWCIQQVRGEAIIAKKQGRGQGQEDTGCRKCLACAKISVLSLINNSTINSELTKGVWQVIKCSKWDGSVEWSSQKGHGSWPKLGLVRVQYRACSAAVPCVPWSRAMSHSLGQVVWVAILAARDVLRCWLGDN